MKQSTNIFEQLEWCCTFLYTFSIEYKQYILLNHNLYCWYDEYGKMSRYFIETPLFFN